MTTADKDTAGSHDPMQAAFQAQAGSCRRLGSPFTARLCDLFAANALNDPSVTRRLQDWPGDPSSLADAVPLRMTAALHALVRAGCAPALAAVYPPHHLHADDTALWTAIDRAVSEHADIVLAWLERPPQTNEVRRAAALLPGFLIVAAETGLPLLLSELGASSGINLHWDRFHYRLGGRKWGDPAATVRLQPDWQGPLPPDAEIALSGRAGCDLQPLDPSDAAQRERLLAYIWPDQTERLERTRAALDIAAAAPQRIARADAIDWLEQRLSQRHSGATHVVYHSIAWQYLDPVAQTRGLSLLEAAGARASESAPLAWLRLEADGGAPGAALTLRLWPNGTERLIGRADFHGRWVEWRGWRQGAARA